ncbi:hypothetical protein D3C87_1210270 [compost metagenome]|jgi:hypothetical protein|uniref:YXWGXW repeat-containing protein n=1 Tax=Cupriavidus campinensis TaxID=151783 RepID=A0AAE9L199_9BURK|nr:MULTISPECIES: YXWGXW repeat-containing protein [Cupriavidus]TSP10105.1 hypothetical protein FGG12_24370 [Cupriavidus campinensis]URF03074.1 YXWGXW repeat-containing protein [Cupriavidus campinensis]CAG2156267.1 hypothetical protein LMG19282_05167 [Cupriavidus campinensis]
MPELQDKFQRRLVRAMTGATLLVATLAFAPAAMAQVNIHIGIGTPPPAPIYEAVPAPRHGYIWQPGYWAWDDHGHKHKWKQGKWAKDRPGYVYESPRWVQASNGWVMQPERWNQGPGDHGKYKDKGGKGCPPGHAKKGEC